MPDRYFESLLGANERVVLITRQHWLVLLAAIISELVLAITLAIMITLVWRVWYPDPRVPLAYLVLIFPLVSLIWDLMKWGRKRYAVTTRRVLEVDGVLSKQVTDSSLEKVNDIKLKQSFFGRIFDYGTIEILTASEAGLSRLTRVAGPIRLKTAILDAKAKLEGPPLNHRASSTEGEILELIDHLTDLQQHGILTEAEVQQKKAYLMSRIQAAV